MAHIEIKNFDHYQHYKERNITSWIKLYYAILDDYKVDQLLEGERWIFIGLLLLAGKYENKIPYDYDFLKKKLCHNKTTKDKLEEMINRLSSLDLVKCINETESRQGIDTLKTESTLKREDNIRIDKKREEESAERDTNRQKLVFGSFKNVHLTEDEYNKLVERYGAMQVGVLIDRLGSYIASRGAERKYKSHYATILSWVLKDKNTVSPGAGQLNAMKEYVKPQVKQTDTELKSYCCNASFTEDKRCSECNEDYSPVSSGIKIALKSV